MKWLSWLSGCLCIQVLLPLWPIAGQKPGQIFRSPLKNFTITVPDFAFGTRVLKSSYREGGLVVFMGGLGDLERIDYARLTDGALAGQDSSTRIQGYRRALEVMVQANHAVVVALEPLNLSGEPVLYALVRFREASQVMQGGKRMDSLRGTLVLLRGDFLYQLSVEVGGLGQAVTDQERVLNGKEAVQRFLGEISFQGAVVPVLRDTARAATAQLGQFPWKAGDAPPPVAGVPLAVSRVILDSLLGAPTDSQQLGVDAWTFNFRTRGVSVVYTLLDRAVAIYLLRGDAGDIGGVRLGDSMAGVLARWGPPSTTDGPLAIYIAGQWAVAITVDSPGTRVVQLGLSRGAASHH